MGLVAVGNRLCRSRNVRTGSMVHRRSPFRLEAHRSSTPQNEFKVSVRSYPHGKFLAPEECELLLLRVCDSSRCGVVGKQIWLHNGSHVQPKRLNNSTGCIDSNSR